MLQVDVLCSGMFCYIASVWFVKTPCIFKVEEKRREKFTLFSDHDGSLPRQQPGAKLKRRAFILQHDSQSDNYLIGNNTVTVAVSHYWTVPCILTRRTISHLLQHELCWADSH